MVVLLVFGLKRLMIESLLLKGSILLQMKHVSMFGGKGHRFSFWPPQVVLQRHSYPWYMDCVSVFLGYFPFTGMASISYGLCCSLEQQDRRWLPCPLPWKEHFEHMASSKKCWCAFQLDQPSTFVGNSGKSDLLLMGSISEDAKTAAEGAEDGLTGANFRLTDNVGFIKKKGCQNPTFTILRTRFTCWKSE